MLAGKLVTPLKLSRGATATWTLEQCSAPCRPTRRIPVGLGLQYSVNHPQVRGPKVYTPVCRSSEKSPESRPLVCGVEKLDSSKNPADYSIEVAMKLRNFFPCAKCRTVATHWRPLSGTERLYECCCMKHKFPNDTPIPQIGRVDGSSDNVPRIRLSPQLATT